METSLLAVKRLEDLTEAQRYQLLVDAVVDYAIYIIDPSGHILTWNSGAVRLKGYAAEEIIGRSFSEFFTPEDREGGVPQRALRTAREEGRFLGEGWRVRKDGSRFWAMAVLDSIRNDDGELIGFAKVTRDITERHAAQVSLQESERRYRRLVEAIVDYAIFQLDPDGYVSSWNVGAERIKGYAPAEILGRHFSLFYTPEDRALDIPAAALDAAATKGRYEAEGIRLRKDGSRFWASVVIDPIRDERGVLLGFAKITRDITERIEAQRELKAIQEQLAASQKLEAIGQLSGGIAHDFNNLLMIVMGNLESAQRYARQVSPAPSLERCLANAFRGAQRAAALTSRLLAFSRRQALDPKPLDVDRFIAGSVDFLQRSLGERIAIEAIGNAGLWPVEVDASHLESALVNLAINARDAMPDGGRLTLEATNVEVGDADLRADPEIAPGHYVAISVSDTGTGMSAEIQAHAFEPFFTTKEVGHGTGLGLSQVHGFVKQSGGHLKIDSAPGRGTSVRLYFPRYLGKGDLGEDAESIAVEPGVHDETILVVEDDDDLRIYLADIVRNLNYRVITAPNAQTALTILLQPDRKIDLLLTDIVMPGIHGRELGRRAREMRPGLPILYMTGYSRNAVMDGDRLEEGLELLQKPVSQSDLALRIRTLLDRTSVGLH